MVLQSLVLIAAMVLVSAAVMTSSLVSARTALHTRALALSHTAMSTTLADFQAWAATIVKTQSARAHWPTTVTTEFKPLCPTTTPQPCDTYLSAKWIVTGGTSLLDPLETPQTNEEASARNLAETLGEQRISATLSAKIVNSAGIRIFGSASQQITARVFDASPYAVVSGSRSSLTYFEGLSHSEGDSGGNAQDPYHFFTSPSIKNPSGFQETRITTAIDCHNSANANNQSNALADGALQSIKSMRNEGTLAWAFEAPCRPSYSIPRSHIVDYISPVNGTYATVQGSSVSRSWNKGDNEAQFAY